MTTTNTGSIQVGMAVIGSNIPEGTTVTAVTPGVSVTLSNNVTATATPTLTYYGGVQSIAFGAVNGAASLGGNNTSWNGNIVLIGGTLWYGSTGLGSGTLTINGGAIGSPNGGGSATNSLPTSIILKGDFTIMGRTFNSGTGSVTLNPTTGNTVTLYNNISFTGVTLNNVGEASSGKGLTVLRTPSAMYNANVTLAGVASFTGSSDHRHRQHQWRSHLHRTHHLRH